MRNNPSPVAYCIMMITGDYNTQVIKSLHMVVSILLNEGGGCFCVMGGWVVGEIRPKYRSNLANHMRNVSANERENITHVSLFSYVETFFTWSEMMCRGLDTVNLETHSHGIHTVYILWHLFVLLYYHPLLSMSFICQCPSGFLHKCCDNLYFHIQVK